MSSFYGGYFPSDSDVEKITNYNNLHNRPITNIVGTNISPVDFSTLTPGYYMISGSYIDIDGTEKTTDALMVCCEVSEEEDAETEVYYIINGVYNTIAYPTEEAHSFALYDPLMIESF